VKEIVIDSRNAGQRAEKFVKNYLKEAPLGFIYKAFRKKDVKVNGHWIKKDAVLQEGDVLRIYVTDRQLEDFHTLRAVQKKPLSYPIVYEDADFLIIDKPSGLLVTGEGKENELTLAKEVLSYLYHKNEYDPAGGSFAPAPAHRLDRNTSGLVMFGKNNRSLSALTEALKNREIIRKTYLSLLVGEISKPGVIDTPLKKDAASGIVKISTLQAGGKEAVTSYKPIRAYKGYTLAEIAIFTGRTHQIRVHMASIGHPVAGDAKYGDFAVNKTLKSMAHFDHQFLHAERISFAKTEGPLKALSGRVFEAPLPSDESKLLSLLEKCI